MRVEARVHVLPLAFAPSELAAARQCGLRLVAYCDNHVLGGRDAEPRVALVRPPGAGAAAAAGDKQALGAATLQLNVPDASDGRLYVEVFTQQREQAPHTDGKATGDAAAAANVPPVLELGTAEFLLGDAVGQEATAAPLALAYRPDGGGDDDDDTGELMQRAAGRPLPEAAALFVQADNPALKGFVVVERVRVVDGDNGAAAPPRWMRTQNKARLREMAMQRVVCSVVATGTALRTLLPVLPVRVSADGGMQMRKGERPALPPSRPETAHMHPFKMRDNNYDGTSSAYVIAVETHLRRSGAADDARVHAFLKRQLRVSLRRAGVPEKDYLADVATGAKTTAFARAAQLTLQACTLLATALPYCSDGTFTPRTNRFQPSERWGRTLLKGGGDCEDKALTIYYVARALQTTNAGDDAVLRAAKHVMSHYVVLCAVTTVNGAQVDDADKEKYLRAMRETAIGSADDTLMRSGGHMTAYAMPRVQFVRMLEVGHAPRDATPIASVRRRLGVTDAHMRAEHPEWNLRLHVLEGTGYMHTEVDSIQAYYRQRADAQQVVRVDRLVRARAALLHAVPAAKQLGDHLRFAQNAAKPTDAPAPDARLTLFFRDTTHVLTGALSDRHVLFGAVQMSETRGAADGRRCSGVALNDLVRAAASATQRAFGLLAEPPLSDFELRHTAVFVANASPVPPLQAPAVAPDAEKTMRSRDDTVPFTVSSAVLQSDDGRRMLEALRACELVERVEVDAETLYGGPDTVTTVAVHTVTCWMRSAAYESKSVATKSSIDDHEDLRQRVDVDRYRAALSGRLAVQCSVLMRTAPRGALQQHAKQFDI
jgi:hypothetical protein